MTLETTAPVCNEQESLPTTSPPLRRYWLRGQKAWRSIMKTPTGKKWVTALACAAALGITSVNAQTLTSNQTGTHDGFYYSFWKDSGDASFRSEEHTSELQSRENLVCRLLLEKKK